MKIRTISIIRLLLFFLLVLDIPYIRHVIGSKSGIYICVEALIVCFLLFIYAKHPSVGIPIVILLLFGIYMFLSTFISGKGFGMYITDFLPILLVCLYFNLVSKDGTASIKELRGWILFLFALVVIDIITIILFPDGLYLGNALYHAGRQRNWFLGYKTNRMAYSFPLVVFYSYYLFQKRRFRLTDLALYVIVFLDMFMTNGSAGSFALFLYLSVSAIYVVSMNKKKKAAGLIARILEKYYLILAIFAVITVTVVLTQSSQRIIKLFSTLFGKTVTMSNRTYIWPLCVVEIKRHFWLGQGMLSGMQYARITGGYLNPHNIVLTYLLTGGIIGLLFAFSYFLYCVRRVKHTDENVLFLLAVYCLLILGITSSTLSYSPFLFVFIFLMHDKRLDKRTSRVEKEINNEFA
jgi:O-antigen ligase